MNVSRQRELTDRDVVPVVDLVSHRLHVLELALVRRGHEDVFRPHKDVPKGRFVLTGRPCLRREVQLPGRYVQPQGHQLTLGPGVHLLSGRPFEHSADIILRADVREEVGVRAYEEYQVIGDARVVAVGFCDGALVVPETLRPGLEYRDRIDEVPYRRIHVPHQQRHVHSVRAPVIVHDRDLDSEVEVIPIGMGICEVARCIRFLVLFGDERCAGLTVVPVNKGRVRVKPSRVVEGHVDSERLPLIDGRRLDCDGVYCRCDIEAPVVRGCHIAHLVIGDLHGDIRLVGTVPAGHPNNWKRGPARVPSTVMIKVPAVLEQVAVRVGATARIEEDVRPFIHLIRTSGVGDRRLVHSVHLDQRFR